ncbi:hypothetical protein EV06_1001 [Prochlorococcus sp. MIT 0602]|nr:hypothetical protein EV06_1001 [Prochlorococcus sp. MIT 0602]KGG17408.1 hypothetical protein EV07_0847 [Prochlorococcus sp. MIT 0603]
MSVVHWEHWQLHSWFCLGAENGEILELGWIFPGLNIKVPL